MRATRLALAILLTALAAGRLAAGSLLLEVVSPLPLPGIAARVFASDGALAAVVRDGERVELPAGTYVVELSTDPPLVKSAVAVPVTGERRVRFDQLGAIKVVVEDESGEVLSTVAEVFLADGRRLDTVASGSSRVLPAGSYRVVVRSKPNRIFEKVKVPAGQIVDVAIRLGAVLALDARGPDGEAVPVAARVVGADGRVLGFAAGETLPLAAGDYDVVLDTVPPLRRKVRLEAGKTERLRLDDLGAIELVLNDTEGLRVPCAVTLLDPRSGLVLARARNGERLVVRPGRYRLRFESEPAVLRDDIVVPARRTVKVGRGGQRAPGPQGAPSP